MVFDMFWELPESGYGETIRPHNLLSCVKKAILTYLGGKKNPNIKIMKISLFPFLSSQL